MDNMNNMNNGNGPQPIPQTANQQQYNTQVQPQYNNVGNIRQTQPMRGWNWGAFMLNICWGIGNKCYLPLLCLLPIFNLFWPFVCGFKGNDWALHSGMYNTVEEFNASQRSWNRAGKVAFWYTIILSVLMIGLWVIMFLFGMGMAGLDAFLSA